MKPTISLLAAAAVVSLLAACSSTPIDSTTASTSAAKPTPTTTAPATTTAATRPAPSSAITTVTLPEYLDPKSGLNKDRSVYFDFDDFSVKPDYQALVEMHGKYLASHPSVAVKIEGNADERGSKEYNLALGQKRAESVLRALKVYGAKDAQVEPVSWGEDKPKAPGHDEAAWAQNRRADVEYPAR